MSTPILYHNLLVLLATIYPVSLPQIATNFIPRQAVKHSNTIYLAGSVFVCTMLLAVSSSLVPMGKLNTSFELPWLIVAVVLAPLLIGLELLIGAVVMKFFGVAIIGWGVSTNWVKVSGIVFALTLVLAILEELLFRQLWGVILVGNLGLPIWGYVLISSVVYGFNHLYYGLTTFVQKIATGVILALLFWYSGGAILMPIIVHTLQNAIILVWGRCR